MIVWRARQPRHGTTAAATAAVPPSEWPSVGPAPWIPSSLHGDTNTDEMFIYTTILYLTQAYAYATRNMHMHMHVACCMLHVHVHVHVCMCMYACACMHVHVCMLHVCMCMCICHAQVTHRPLACHALHLT